MRLFHVWVYSPGVKPYILDSVDEYTKARSIALERYNIAEDDTKIEVTSCGAIVWGPYVKGGKYKP